MTLRRTHRPLALLLALAACNGGDDIATTGTGTDSDTSSTGTTTTTGTSTSAAGTPSASGTASETGTSTTASTTDATASTTDATSTTVGPATCGNGQIEAGEECDDGNDVDTDACTSACQIAVCGDAIVQADVEECDDGNQDDADACTHACQNAVCGDAIVGPGEACDDGNQVDDDACSNLCALPTCGDAKVQQGEECDDGNDDNTDLCLDTCLGASCGDSFVQADVEECDDGNADNTDACTTACKKATCGDGFVQPPDQCDDGNKVNADACSLLCHKTPKTITLAPGQNTATYGGAGGSAFDDSCPPGQALIGFTGKLDGNNWHGNVAGACGTLTVGVAAAKFVVKVGPAGALPLHGAVNQSGQTWDRLCPADQVVVGFSGRSATLIDQLTFTCAPLVISEDGVGFSLGVGAKTNLAPIGGNGGNAFPQTDCPAGQVANRQRGRAGNDLDQFGLGCAIPGLTF